MPPGTDTALRVNVAQMRAHRRIRNRQLFGDFLGTVAPGDVRQNIPFPRRQWFHQLRIKPLRGPRVFPNHVKQPSDKSFRRRASGQHRGDTQIARPLRSRGITRPIHHDDGHARQSRLDRAQHRPHAHTDIHIGHDDVGSSQTAPRPSRQIGHVVDFEYDSYARIPPQGRPKRTARHPLRHEHTDTERHQPGHTSCTVVPGVVGRCIMVAPPSFNFAGGFPSYLFDETRRPPRWCAPPSARRSQAAP